MKMSTNVTGNLHNICQSMANVLEQNRSTLEVLGMINFCWPLIFKIGGICIFHTAQSSNTVTDTQDEYKVMGSTLNSTKKLISRYGRREMTNIILFLLSVLAFLATCLYVIVQRTSWFYWCIYCLLKCFIQSRKIRKDHRVINYTMCANWTLH